MTTTESTIIAPVHPGLDDVDAPEPMPRPRRRRRTALAVLGVALVLVAARLAGALTGGGRATSETADREVGASRARSSTSEPGVETSSTVIERDTEDAAGNSSADDDGTGQPAGDGGDDASQPGVDAPQLDISTTSLAFGQQATKKSFTIENDGDAPMTWDAQEAKPWMSATPVEGDLAPGASQVIEVTVSRAGMPKGTSFQGDLTIASDGGDAVVHVTGSTPFDLVQPVPADVLSVNHQPVICSVSSPSGPKTTPIVAKVSGPGIDGVKLYWSMGGGFPSGIDMVKSGTDTWMVPAFGNLPQGVVKIAVFVENQYGEDLVERQIVVNHCP